MQSVGSKPIQQSPIANMEIPGLNELWGETLGDSSICIAILDGSVDQSHTSLARADLTRIETLVSGEADHGPASQHGTHIASVIFGHHDGPVKGIAPRCRGVVIPVFKDGDAGSIAPCSQVDLARAIGQAVQAGAHIVNISGGELTPSGTAHPLLADAIKDCANRGVLIVAAAGNEGCECLHIPGALPSVLAVGAMNAQGEPMGFSNWGKPYQAQGVLALGENIQGAIPGGGVGATSGTSYATPIVSGVAALMLSLQLKLGQKPDAQAVRAAILKTAIGCDEQPVSDCRRLLAGRLNIKGAMRQIRGGKNVMSETNSTTATSPDEKDSSSTEMATARQPPSAQVQAASFENGAVDTAMEKQPSGSTMSTQKEEVLAPQGSISPSNVKAAACECGGTAPKQLVFAFGQLGYDFGTEARRDSIMQHMKQPANPHDPLQLLTYLKDNPWDAAAILWTLNLDATPIYAVQAQGGFASAICQRLCEFLGDQAKGEVERVSIPGYIAANARLFTGQVVPIIYPALRGMYSWNTTALVQTICGTPPQDKAPQKEKDEYGVKAQAIANFLRRVYEEIRNLGVTPQHRAINYAATNVYQVSEIFKEAIKDDMELDTIEVERSPIGRPDSDCWDMKMTCFNPKQVFVQARKVYRCCVDVSDVVPVMVGPMRSWYVR
ncbi:MAG: PatA/PatG family cyanobactin maturation protease [Nitrospira sp.]|nr:PatA/PatG family cyanobactin maturation protease [Nitrospira sp.]MDH4243313.1 PatA/PatG family cyanobactin maturation protease [Nitrospira sp.]MDH4356354.1 PatA/PatG family cyanobactin maturation protease [Nitrospira sp.]MDH5320511.1 PatA/PatG family cyanobactin maturation protease [Nitrospira sp.]